MHKAPEQTSPFSIGITYARYSGESNRRALLFLVLLIQFGWYTFTAYHNACYGLLPLYYLDGIIDFQLAGFQQTVDSLYIHFNGIHPFWNVALQPLLYLPMSVLVCAIRPTTRRDWVYLLLSLVPVAGVFFWLGLLRKYLTEMKPAWVRYLRILSIFYATWLCLPVCVLFVMSAFGGFLPMELMIRTPQQLAGSNELSYLFHINMYVAGLAHIPLFAVGWIPVASTWQDYKRHLRTHRKRPINRILQFF